MSREKKSSLELLVEILELFKFVKINDEASKFIILRTSQDDNFINYIDEIIYLRESFQSIIAIDITTTSDEGIQINKVTKFIRILNRGEGRIKHSFIAQKDNEGRVSFKRSRLSEIPVFIIHINASYLLEKKLKMRNLILVIG